MDGTFDSAPYPFKQVFCISVVSASGRIVPVLWALLSSKSKTKKMYREGVFRPLYNLLVERNNGNALETKTIISDFERAIFTAFFEVFGTL